MKCETPTVLLRGLVEDFNRGAIQLPQFQRDYVWRPRAIRNLLDSLLTKFPIGGFYLWRPSVGTLVDKKAKAFGSQFVESEFKGYLIDGQQRLTSLEAAFGLYTGEDKRGDALRCYLDLGARADRSSIVTRIFVTYAGNKSIKRRVDAADSTLVPLSELFNGHNPDLRRRIEEALRSRDWSATRIADALARIDAAAEMLNQLVPCTSVSDISDTDAIEVFRRLNRGGTPLRESDVQAAKLARGRTVKVLKRMREFVNQELPQRLGFAFSFAFRALVIFHKQSAKLRALSEDWIEDKGPHHRTLWESWQAAERAIGEALSFVD